MRLMIAEGPILQGPALGALTESAVVAELLKAAHDGGTRTPTVRHADNLVRWCALTGGSGLLACRTDRIRTLGRGIRAVPWHFCQPA